MTFRYKIHIFKELVEKYPSWNELRSYLESEEGGLFRVVDQMDPFCMIRYEKGSSNMELPHSKWFRSVVWNTILHRPVCIAPPKASNDFSLELDGMTCQELLDGFMINCFRVDKTLHITSRSKLNAAGTFYSDKSFRDLFIEAYMNTMNCPYYNETIIQNCSNDIQRPLENELSVFYSFLVQHKEHRIVKKIDKNRVFVVHRGIILENGIVELEDTPNVFTKIETIPYTSIHNMMQEKDWQFQGIVIKDNKGNRWKVRSDKYNTVKSLRGNSSSTCDRFAQLFTQNLLCKYLEYYDDETSIMMEHVMFINNIVKTLYDYYVEMHIKKTKIKVDNMFLPHLYNIHGIYLNHLRPNRLAMSDILLYLQKQPWQRISFLMKRSFF